MANLPSAYRARFETLRELDYSSISTTLPTVIGTSFTNQIRMIKIQNLTDVAVYILDDNYNKIDKLLAYSFSVYDVGTNKAAQSGCLELAVGFKLYAQADSTLPSTGSVTITALYASES